MTEQGGDQTYDVIVVGSGPLGSATARHAAESGASVLLVGPEEPADPAGHEGTWAGYYDSGRMCHVLEVPLVTSLLTMRSVRRFPDLIERTGVDFLTPVESVMVLPSTPPDGSAAAWFDKSVLAGNGRDLGVELDDLSEEQLAAVYPKLTFEPGHEALRQRDAFILNPRELVRAELVAAERAGATIVRDEVVALETGAHGVRVTAASGRAWHGTRVVAATGAATNAAGLLPRPLVTPTFGATVVLAEVDGPDAVDMPTMMMLKFRDGERVFGGVVMAPVQYPDGRWYLKVSGSNLLENPLDTREEIAAWVRTGGEERDIDETRVLLGELLPGTTFKEFRKRPCLVCATATDRPYIDWADERTIVLVEGERGAMSGDEIGRLASSLALTGAWSDTIPQEVFAAVWAEPGWRTTTMLAGLGG